MLVVSSVGGSVVVVLVDVLVVEVVDVVDEVEVTIVSWGASVIGVVAEFEPEQPATIVAPHIANRRPT
jgi:hypothetical protein